MRTAKTDQTGRMPRMIRVFVDAQVILLVLSYSGSDINELGQDKTYKMTCAYSEDMDQPEYP